MGSKLNLAFTQSKFHLKWTWCSLLRNYSLSFFSYIDKVDLCYDYSFWQTSFNRCSSPDDKYAVHTHPYFCDRATDCRDTYHNGFCQDSSSEEKCQGENEFLCKYSRTCIKKGKVSKLPRYFVTFSCKILHFQKKFVMVLYIASMLKMKILKFVNITFLRRQQSSVLKIDLVTISKFGPSHVMEFKIVEMGLMRIVMIGKIFMLELSYVWYW